MRESDAASRDWSLHELDDALAQAYHDERPRASEHVLGMHGRPFRLVHVLRKTDREGEGMARLKVAVVRLMRPEVAQEDLDVLASSLGEEVELSAVLQWDA